MPLSQEKKRLIGVMIALIGLTAAAYWQVGDCGFLNYDDDLYVTANPHVQAGVTAESIAWAFKATEAANWRPLTWLSHILDGELYGLKPARHHLTSLVIHISNVLLLLWLFFLATGALWRSAFAARLIDD